MLFFSITDAPVGIILLLLPRVRILIEPDAIRNNYVQKILPMSNRLVHYFLWCN
jgi:hypothetical protein